VKKGSRDRTPAGKKEGNPKNLKATHRKKKQGE